MAYYPGYRTRPQDIGDYYSQGLFGGATAPVDIDPYTDPHNRDDHHHDGPRRDSPTLHHPHRTHDPSKLPPRSPLRPTASPPSSSPPMAPSALTSTPPPATSPSPSYFSFASIPSKILSEPTRKLLVLDLNGTLLLRAARPPKSYRGQHQQYPAPRRVMPRPYLTALRAYLFAPQTRAWLDVMVWSSAQPRNVEDMVLHAFGSDRDQLVAIWARDTLGLAEDHYYHKVQTIKDLEKPWEALAPERQRPASLPSKPKSKLQLSSPTWMGHSAATTILLDDSHAKAARQPHNHLYIPEYTRALRNADIAAFQHAQVHSREDQEEEATALPDAGSKNEALQQKRKRKRERKKEQPTQPTADVPAPAFDEMLLAVIGILHAARLQSSIAGWLRAGALLSERGAVWCEDPTLVHTWARRGRDAMQELQLEIKQDVVEP